MHIANTVNLYGLCALIDKSILSIDRNIPEQTSYQLDPFQLFMLVLNSEIQNIGGNIMKLLLKRSQSKPSMFFSLIPFRLGRGVIFTIHAELEVDDKELSVINRYNLADACIVGGNMLADFKKCIMPMIVIFLSSLFALNLLIDSNSAFLLASIAGFVTFWYAFFQLREYVIVKQLLNGGRKFHCDNIVRLVQRESELNRQCTMVAITFESARTWDDREAISIPKFNKDEAREFADKHIRLPIELT